MKLPEIRSIDIGTTDIKPAHIFADFVFDGVWVQVSCLDWMKSKSSSAFISSISLDPGVSCWYGESLEANLNFIKN
ncbi:hypothetical protein GYA19_00275, partial [Candidatus Beckwithbacteria bacterium]|nr:hypothetical protein [Candidatus Beckwithbacteria bacterium]